MIRKSKVRHQPDPTLGRDEGATGRQEPVADGGDRVRTIRRHVESLLRRAGRLGPADEGTSNQ